MKKIFIGFIWFLVIWIGSILLITIVASFFISAKVVQETEPGNYEAAIGPRSHALVKTCAPIVFWGALAIAIGATAFELLPGTKTDDI